MIAYEAAEPLPDLELRRQLLRRASTLATRARVSRARGDTANATRLHHAAALLLKAARGMNYS
jgi:hypothetical protein